MFAAADANTSYVAISAADGRIHILTADAELLYTVDSGFRVVTALAISNDSATENKDDFAVMGSPDGEIALLDILNR
jgi:hypothetical protein